MPLFFKHEIGAMLINVDMILVRFCHCHLFFFRFSHALKIILIMGLFDEYLFLNVRNEEII